MSLNLRWVKNSEGERAGGPPEIPHVVVSLQVPTTEVIQPDPQFASEFPKKISSSDSSINLLIEENRNAFAFPAMLKRPEWPKARRVNVVIIPTKGEKTFIFHPNCKAAGIGADKREELDSTIYVATYCRATDTSVTLFLINSRASKLTPQGAIRAEAVGERWQRYMISKPAGGWEEANCLGKFVLEEDSTARNSSTSFAVLMNPIESRAPKTLRLTAGLAVSAAHFAESAHGIKVTEFELMARTTANYSFKKSRWGLSGGAFGTLVPAAVSVVPPGTPSSRSFGLTGDIVYGIPSTPNKHLWRVSAGWYWAGMLVPDKAYGVGSYYGPSLGLSVSAPEEARQKYCVFGRYSYVGEMSSLSLKNLELVLGSMVDVGSLRENPLSFLIEFSYLKLNTADGLNPFSSWRSTAGLMLRFDG